WIGLITPKRLSTIPTLSWVPKGSVSKVKCASRTETLNVRSSPESSSLARLQAHRGAGVGIDLPEEIHLDRPNEEAVAAPRESAGVRALHPLGGEVPDEVANDPEVEQQLAGPALAVQLERLPRP